MVRLPLATLKRRGYTREIWSQMHGKYNDQFLVDLFEGLAAREADLRDVVSTVCRTWGYPEDDVLTDLVPASWSPPEPRPT